MGWSGSSAFPGTIHCCSVDVFRGLMLLFGIGTKALPLWELKTRWNNLLSGLAIGRTAGPRGPDVLTSSIVPRGPSFHRSVEFECSPIVIDGVQPSFCRHDPLSGPTELSAVDPYAVHDHSQPSCQRHDRLLHPAAPGDLHLAEALSQDHFFERSILCAAS